MLIHGQIDVSRFAPSNKASDAGYCITAERKKPSEQPVICLLSMLTDTELNFAFGSVTE